MANEQMLCLDKFIKEVKEDLTVACQIPINIPNKELIRITRQTKKYFYKIYEDSVEEKFFILSQMTWDTDEFKSTRVVVMPDNVFSVHGIYQIGEEHFGSRGWNNVDPDFALDKFIYSDLYTPSRGSENMMYYVINESFYDMARQMFVNKLSYNYNRLTKKLRFTGELPTKDTVCMIYQHIDDCALYEDEAFFRWVVAQAKIQMSRVLGIFGYQLPGNITINYDMIRDEGKEEIDFLREEIKGDEGVDYFLTS